MSSTPGFTQPNEPSILRITTFRVPADRPTMQAELRRLPRLSSARFRWIGRRLMDDPAGAEIAFVTLWDSAAAMERDIPVAERELSSDFVAVTTGRASQLFSCRAFGRWERDAEPCLLRIFRGGLIEGEVAAFDPSAAAEYLANFERNPRCASIVAAVREGGVIVLVTLWTNWDAVVSATGGDMRQVLPVKLAGFEVAGSAIHYEAVSVAW